MTYTERTAEAVNYFPCRYGASKLLFRGPRRKLRGDFVTYLGGTETYGKFIETPFPMLLEIETGLKSVNLGCANVGVDAYLGDHSLIDICAKSQVTVLQVMGAHNMSNRFYTVHPRRNDRFLRASSVLQMIFPDVDFTEFHFTRHLLTALAQHSESGFEMVRAELKAAWLARMRSLIDAIDGKVVLLWIADHAAEDAQGGADSPDPLFVDREMIDALSDRVARVVEVVADPAGTQDALDEMAFRDMDFAAAQGVLGPQAHRLAATALAPVLSDLARPVRLAS